MDMDEVLGEEKTQRDRSWMGVTQKKKTHGLYSINCNSWWIHRMFVVSNNIVWISVRRPGKMKSNQLQSFPTIFIFLNLSCPVLSCPEADKYLCVWCLSVFFNGDIYSIQNRHPNFSSKTQQQQLYIEWSSMLKDLYQCRFLYLN
jgi:hypothetical protein